MTRGDAFRLSRHAAAAAAFVLVPPHHALGQRIADARFQAADFTSAAADTRENPVVEIAKWSTGALALTAGAFAFIVQHDAEDQLEELERFCIETPSTCRELTATGAYADPEVEARYQALREDYRNSRLLLIAAHVLAATSVVLFVVDLPRGTTPENVPYEPPALRVGVRPGGVVEAAIRYPVSNIFRRSP
ncbi:MAG TPA: hypothetical protein VMN78_06560 [Longimicrobiales bacterium]|nr:hypothetical protein [Longimicrobiales bacterium]